jgi:hypothetical protein
MVKFGIGALVMAVGLGYLTYIQAVPGAGVYVLGAAAGLSLLVGLGLIATYRGDDPAPANSPEFAHPLHARLAALRHRLRFAVLCRGAGSLAALLLAGILLGMGLDWGMNLPSPVRALLLVSLLAGAGAVAYRFLIAPLKSKLDDLSLALQVEDKYPVLNDALASTVQFLQQPDDDSSPTLKREAVARALRLAQGCDFNVLVDRRGLRWVLLAAVASFALTAYIFLAPESYPHAPTALARFLDPFGNHTWATLDDLELRFQTTLPQDKIPKQIPKGKALTLSGNVGGLRPEFVKVEMPGHQALTVAIDKKGHFELKLPSALTDRQGTLRFRVTAYDAAFPPRRGQWREIPVLPPPELARNWPKLEYRHPAYTELPPQMESPGNGDVDVWAGTLVTLTGVVDRPITNGWIEYRPKDFDAQKGQKMVKGDLIKPALLLNTVAATGTLDALSRYVVGRAVWDDVPAKIDADGKKFTVSFRPWISGHYALRLNDGTLEKEYVKPLKVKPDPVPTVQWLRPSPEQKHYLLPTARLSVQIKAADKIFALRSAFLEYQLRDVGGSMMAEPRRVPMYDHAKLGGLIPQVFAALGGPMPVRSAPWHMRLQNIEQLPYRWSLQGLFKEGDVVIVRAAADDFNDVVPFNPPGYTAGWLEIHIVGKELLGTKLDEKMAEIQQDVVKARDKQNQAVDEIEKVKNRLAKLDDEKDPKKRENILKGVKEDLLAAKDKQKEVQKLVGPTPDDGVRGKLDKLQQMIKDNELPPSNLQDRARALEQDLERVAQEHLPQIEQKLADAQKKLDEKAEKADDKKPAPKKEGPLDGVQSLQQNAKKTLDELVQSLNPWANAHQVKSEAQKLLDRQRDLKKETKRLEENKAKAKPEDIALAAKKQQALADQMKALLGKMEKMVDKKENKEFADQLKEAIEAAKTGVDGKTPISANMEKASTDLKDANGGEPKHNQAMAEQQKAIAGLEKLTAAFEEQRDKAVQEMLNNQLKAEAKIAEFLKQQQDINKAAKELEVKLARKQKDLKDAIDKKDPDAIKKAEAALAQQKKENDKAFAELAKKQEALRQQVQQHARDMGKVNAGAAGREMERAAKEMERVVQVLEKRENPEEPQKEAEANLAEAMNLVQDAEDELLREQLAKIEDKLKGLKERQDNAIKEMVRLHDQAVGKEKMANQKFWDRILLTSLAELRDSQKDLGRETDALKDKLKGAKVFQLILEKAAKDMDDASLAMEERRELASERAQELQRAKEIERQPFIDKWLPEEIEKQRTIVKHQTDAARRLQRLLDAVKNEEFAKKPELPKDADQKDPKKQADPKKDENKARPAGDGIPDIAQLKALRDEQKDLNDRTRAFVERQIAAHVAGGGALTPVPLEPESLPMNDAQRRELTAIQAEQTILRDLFQEMTKQANPEKGDEK